MAFTKAGLWGPQAIIDSSGHPQPGATATLYLPDEVTLASLWTTSAKSVAVANPTQADIHANLHFWTDPGQYRLRVNVGTVVTWLDVEVPIDPGEAAQDQDVVAAQAAAEAYADGIVAAGLATKQPLDSDLTAIAALSTTAFGRGLLILADAAAGRAAFGAVIGTDVQAHDSDLDAIAALATTAFGRALLVLADAAALRTAAGLGSAATHASTDFDAAGTAAAAVAAVVAGAPGALDTLNELATALADDANFATTITNALAGKQQAVARTAVKTTNYSAAAGDLVPVDTTSGAVTVTLPNAPTDKSTIAVKHIIQGGTNVVTIACAGADVFNRAGGGTTATLPYANQAMLLEYTAAGAIWSVIADDLPLSQLDLRFAPITGIPESAVTSLATDLAAKALILNPTAVKTANYSAVAGDYVLCDTSGGIFTVTLPTAPADKTSIAVDLVASGNTLTIARGGADVFQKAGGPTSLTMNTANRVLVLQYQSSIAVWHVQDHLPAVINTKGDLLTYSTERARLAVGADGALLGADSTQATGLKWIPSGTYVSSSEKAAANGVATLGANSIVPDSQLLPGLRQAGRLFNAKDYGAVGDGLTNDSTAFGATVAAAAAAGNGVAYFPAGVYLVTPRTISQSNVKLLGDGPISEIRQTGNNAADPLVNITGNNVTLDNLKLTRTTAPYALRVDFASTGFLGDRLTPNAVILSGSRMVWRRGSGVWIYSANDVVVEDCVVVYPLGSGGGNLVSVTNGCTRVTVRNNTLLNYETDNGNNGGIHVTQSTDVVIENNYLYQPHSHGIFLDGDNGVSTTPVIRNNTVIRPGAIRADGGPSTSGVQCNGAVQPFIAGNRVHDCGGYGIYCGGTGTLGASKGYVVNNHISGCGDPGLSTRNSKDITFRGNAVDSCTWGMALGEAPGDAPVHRAQVVGNTFSKCNFGGVQIRGSSNNVVRDNHFIDCGYDRTTTGWNATVILIVDDGLGGSCGNQIRRNTVSRGDDPTDAASKTLSQPIYFARDDVGATKSKGNVVRDNYLAGIHRNVIASATPGNPQGPCRLGATDVESGHDLGAGELLLDLATGGSNGSADATNKTTAAASWIVQAAGGTTNTVQWTLPAFTFSDLPDDAMFEIELWAPAASAANFSQLQLRFGVGASDANAMAWTPLASPQIDTSGVWHTFRFRKGDANVLGTATWSNITTLRVALVANSGGLTQVNVANLRVYRAV